MTDTDDVRALLQRELGQTYQIERELGGGGMSRVFVADELRLGRKVVIKVLPPELHGDISAQRFERELQLGARLQQANIVPVFAAGSAAGSAYYVMPYIAWQSLRDRLRAAPIPVPAALSVLRDILRALAYAHGEGVVHRDIKPENVLLSGDTAVVTDFGIAKALDAARMPSSGTITQLGTAVGTPAYMAPEQAAGDDVDHRSDLYAWGVVAYELLAGHHPFTGRIGSRALMTAQIVETPPRLAHGDVPGAIVDVVMHCLEKDPAQRPSSAREVLDAFDHVAVGATVSMERIRPAVVERSFTLTDEVCRRIERTLLDPRIIGGRMQWFDNGVASDTLVVCVHGTGGDGGFFRELLETLPYRVIAPSFFGFEPGAPRRVPLSLETHIVLLRELVRSAVAELRPTRVIAFGFSSGGDVCLRLGAGLDSNDLTLHAIVAAGANMAVDNTWLSRRLARVTAVNEAALLESLKAISESLGDVMEWLNVNGYLLDVIRKFQSDMEPLRVVASGLARPFEAQDWRAFAQWYREASARVPVVLCVTEDTDTTRRILQEIRLRNLDERVLGDAYREDSIWLDSTHDHFELAAAERVGGYIAKALEQLRRQPVS